MDVDLARGGFEGASGASRLNGGPDGGGSGGLGGGCGWLGGGLAGAGGKSAGTRTAGGGGFFKCGFGELGFNAGSSVGDAGGVTGGFVEGEDLAEGAEAVV